MRSVDAYVESCRPYSLRWGYFPSGLLSLALLAVLIMMFTEDRKPVGIVTDRDITLRCVVDELDCAKTPVEKIMTKLVETVTIDDGIFDVIQVMKKNEIRRVPVVDSAGTAVGLLSFGDVYHLVGKEISDLLAPIAPEQPKIVDKAA